MVDATAAGTLHFARDEAPASRRGTASPTSMALDNLRGIVILIVLGFHSALAYVSWTAPATTGFDSPPFNWRAFPIVDNHRFFGFDLLCAWQDVYLMSLMFFLSGLFVWPSLARKKAWGFTRDRVLRLGIPYLFGIAAVIPLATYPAYSVRTADPSLSGYWHALLALPFWPNGPLWFLWQLLALNILAACVYRLAPEALRILGRRSAAAAGTRIARYFAALVGASAIAYVPLALAYTPWAWSNSGLLAVQFCRPLNYAVYFFAGLGIGVEGIDRGLLAVGGALARRWARWLGLALASVMLWMGVTALTLRTDAPIGAAVASDLAYVVACAAGCFFLIALTLHFAPQRSPLLGRLGADAYGLYLFHYVFVVWLQYLLLALPMFALFKATIVFGLTIPLTWITVTLVQRIPLGARLIGSTRRRVAGLAPSAPR
jgi:surface polysaccharide O-acyltransferase-like enzyme